MNYEPKLQLITFDKIAYKTIVEVKEVCVYINNVLIATAYYQHKFLSAN